MGDTALAGVGEGRVSCQVTGGGPAVLFIHGGATDSRLWDGQVSELAEEYRVITYDMCGFGSSPRPTRPYRMSDDAIAVLDHLGVISTAVVGFSIGAQIAPELDTMNCANSWPPAQRRDDVEILRLSSAATCGTCGSPPAGWPRFLPTWSTTRSATPTIT